MRCSKKTISVFTLFSLLFSVNYPSAKLLAAPLPLAITEDAFALPEAKVGTEYAYQFQSEGGLAPLRWRVLEGELPAGITLELSGKLRGVPTTPRREAY